MLPFTDGPRGAAVPRVSLCIRTVYTRRMAVTKVFRSGNSQAVRIPREFQLDGKEVEIYRRGDEIVLRELPGDLSGAFELLGELSDDFFREGRRQPETDGRPDL